MTGPEPPTQPTLCRVQPLRGPRQPWPQCQARLTFQPRVGRSTCHNPGVWKATAASSPADTCRGGRCGPTAWGTLRRPGIFPATAASSLGSCPLLTFWSQAKCWRVPRAVWGDDQKLSQRLTRNLEWLVPWTWPHRVPSAQELKRHTLATWQNVPEGTPSRLPPRSSHAHLPPPLLSP